MSADFTSQLEWMYSDSGSLCLFFAETRPVAPENRCSEDFLEGHHFRCYVGLKN